MTIFHVRFDAERSLSANLYCALPDVRGDSGIENKDVHVAAVERKIVLCRRARRGARERLRICPPSLVIPRRVDPGDVRAERPERLAEKLSFPVRVRPVVGKIAAEEPDERMLCRDVRHDGVEDGRIRPAVSHPREPERGPRPHARGKIAVGGGEPGLLRPVVVRRVRCKTLKENPVDIRAAGRRHDPLLPHGEAVVRIRSVPDVHRILCRALHQDIDRGGCHPLEIGGSHKCRVRNRESKDEESSCKEVDA